MTTHRARLGIEQEGPLAIVTFNDTRILDQIAIREIRAEFDVLVDEIGMRQLLIDFEGVEALSSSALGALVSLRERLKSVNGKIWLAGLTSDARRLFSLTKLDQMFTIFADREEALVAIRGRP